MLVSFALGNAKVWRWGSKPTPVPNANGFASQWNIGFTVHVEYNRGDTDSLGETKIFFLCYSFLDTIIDIIS